MAIYNGMYTVTFPEFAQDPDYSKLLTEKAIQGGLAIQLILTTNDLQDFAQSLPIDNIGFSHIKQTLYPLHLAHYVVLVHNGRAKVLKTRDD